jgi:hypothetical protein
LMNARLGHAMAVTEVIGAMIPLETDQRARFKTCDLSQH